MVSAWIKGATIVEIRRSRGTQPLLPKHGATTVAFVAAPAPIGREQPIRYGSDGAVFLVETISPDIQSLVPSSQTLTGVG